MDCLFMRHGMAVEGGEWSEADDTRPLTADGKNEVAQVAASLVTLQLTPSHLFTSPLTRAQETAKIVGMILCPAITMAFCKALEPGSSPQFLMTFIRTLPHHSVVLCIGHEPLLGTMASYLLSGEVSQSYPMSKAGVGLIHLPSSAGAGMGILRWWTTPAQLMELSQVERATMKTLE